MAEEKGEYIGSHPWGLSGKGSLASSPPGTKCPGGVVHFVDTTQMEDRDLFHCVSPFSHLFLLQPQRTGQFGPS